MSKSYFKEQQHPFGDYIEKKLGKKRHKYVKELFSLYAKMDETSTLKKFLEAACAISKHIDKHLKNIQTVLGGGVTPFSTFRGDFLEEVILKLAHFAGRDAGNKQKLNIEKLHTGDGIITGIVFAFSVGKVPQNVPVRFHHDREDVIVGFRRTLLIEVEENKPTQLPNQLIPICIVACKMYVDATRLENILAKVKNMYGQYALCRYYAVAEWDALRESSHGSDGRILDSLYAPITEIIFVRGFKAQRPPNDKLKEASIKNPYLQNELRRIHRMIKESIQRWA